MSRSARVALVVGALVVGPVAGCGGDGGSAQSISPGAVPGPAGVLAIAVPAPPRELDPLLATGGIDQLVTQQTYEPLIERLSGPYDDMRRVPGLVTASRPGDHRTIWRLRLRENVRFQDGTRFNASAVLDNAARWRETPEGRALLPGLVAVDAPQPDLVRFIFDRPDPALRAQLSSPRLGIVSPRVLRSGAARLGRGLAAGTGPFELRERGPDRVLMARNVGWWGTRHGLGPAVDQVELRVESAASERLRLLRHGEVQAATDLPVSAAPLIRRDPLLTAARGQGGVLGLERSVRGLDLADGAPLLSETWLTRIGVQ